MTEYEKVEKLREKTGVSYEEARAALEENDWDLLNAIVALEKQGKVAPDTASHSTRTETDETTGHEEEKSGFSRRAAGVWSQIQRLIHIGNTNNFVVTRKDKLLLKLPVTALVLLVLFGHLWTLAVLAIGLFAGLRYSIEGEQLGTPQVNDVMDKAADAAKNVRETVEDSLRKNAN